MSLRLKRYPSYKDSGVEWLGEIPAHWEIKRPRRLFNRLQLPVEPEDEVVTCFRDGMVTLRKKRRVTGFTESIKEIGYQRVCKGDLVIHAMDAFAGAIGVSDSDGKCTPVYAVCRAIRGDNPYYFAYIVREMARNGFILSLSKGIRERSTDFRFETFATQSVAVPPVEEQATIVRFLDALDRRVNRLLRIKRRLIVLLNEQKQAIIHHAVTKGLNPDAPMKPSSIDWLGEIPAHWGWVKIKYLGKMVSGYSFDSQSFTNKGVRVLKIANIQNMRLDWSDESFVPEAFYERFQNFAVTDGDLVFALTRPIVSSGIKVAIAQTGGEKILLNQRNALFKPNQKVVPTFFYYSLFSELFLKEFKLCIDFTGQQPNISAIEISNIKILLPPIQEQDKIVKYINDELELIDKIIKGAIGEIELIQEYRTRLIADVVTGKLDVREAILPDAFPVDEGSDELLVDAEEEGEAGEGVRGWGARNKTMTEIAKQPNTNTNSTTEPKPLLRSIILCNFLSFGPDNQTIKLGTLNVLIGANGAGKSNLIEAIALMRASSVSSGSRDNGNLESVVRRGGGVEEWIWKGKPSDEAIISFAFEYKDGDFPLVHGIIFEATQQQFHLSGEAIFREDFVGTELDVNQHYYVYTDGEHIINVAQSGEPRKLGKETIEPNVSILAQRNDPEQYPEISFLIKQYNKIAIYREWAFGRETIFRQPQRADMRVDRLEEDFSNLGLVLNRLYGFPKTKREILERLRDVYEGVDDFHISIYAGFVQIFFNEGDFRIPANRLSDGTLRYLCLLAILCDPTPPPLICIEEPELGLHPDILPKIADLLIQASQRTQLIVTTHSDIIVDSLTNQPESVLIVEKHDGQTVIKHPPALEPGERLGTAWIEGKIGGTRW